MKKILVFLCLNLLCFCIKAQLPELPKSMTSPNVANLGQYGQVPITPFTGSPSISIPLYDFKVDNVSIPISLSYLSSSVKPDNHPSWVGLGWSLNAGGVISRVVNNLPDEYHNNKVSTGLGCYVKQILDVKNWYKGEFILSLASADSSFNYNNDPGRPFLKASYDTQPDQFSFNFLDYQGKFYLNHKGEVIVECNKPVKVLFSNKRGIAPFSTLNTIASPELEGFSPYFSEFTIITEDGNEFVFGRNPDAIDLSVDFFHQATNEWIATAWHLTEINLLNGQKVSLEYERGRFLGQFYYTSLLSSGYSIGLNMGGGNTISRKNANATPDYAKYQGHLVSPVYLKKIHTSDSDISFVKSKSHELTLDPSIIRDYEIEHLRSKDIREEDWYMFNFRIKEMVGIMDVLFPILNEEGYRTTSKDLMKDLTWYKLDRIKINNKDDKRIFSFSYIDKPEERLILKSIEEQVEIFHLQNSEPSIEESLSYNFEYNHPELLPPYLSMKTDHWGYYNGTGEDTFFDPYHHTPIGGMDSGWLNPFTEPNTSIISDSDGFDDEFLLTSYHDSREPNPEVMGYGLLNKITYPTKGYTRFVFEPNMYKKQVSLRRDSCQRLDTLKIGAGLRIKEVWNSPSGNKVDEIKAKEYFYVEDYFNHRDDASECSGVLGSQIKYSISYDLGSSRTLAHAFYNALYTQSCLPNASNIYGSFVGYTTVVEKRPDGSFTEYKYSNFDNGYLDNPPICTLLATNLPYEPCCSKDMERGLILKQKDYNNQFKLLQSKGFKYEKDKDLLSSSIRMLKKQFIHFGSSLFTFNGTTYLVYTYKMRLKSDTTKIYEKGLTTPKTVINEYTYNDCKLLKETKTKTPFKVLKETYKYVSDYPDDAIYAQMKKKNILSPIVEKKSLLKTESNAVYKLLKGTRCEYKKWSTLKNNLYLPSLIEISESGGVYKPSANIQKYDSRGHAVYFIDSNNVPNVFIWGYNYKYLVGIIKNSTLEEVEKVLGNLDNFSSANTPNFTLLEQLRRRLSNAEVAYGKYCSFGLTEQIDARGIPTYYQYDSFGRLSKKKDYNGNLLADYSYKYKGQSITSPNPNDPTIELSASFSLLDTYQIGNQCFKVDVFSKKVPNYCEYHYFWTLEDSDNNILLEKETTLPFLNIRLCQIGETKLTCRIEERITNQVISCSSTFNVEKAYVGFTDIKRVCNADLTKKQIIYGIINCVDTTTVKFKLVSRKTGKCRFFVNEIKDSLMGTDEKYLTKKLSKGKNVVALEMIDNQINAEGCIKITDVCGLNQIALNSFLHLWLVKTVEIDDPFVNDIPTLPDDPTPVN